MTKLGYLHGCLAGSKEHRRASSPSDNAIYVNLHNGNVNWNNQNNTGRVRAVRRVRASEGQSAEAVVHQELISARREAKRGKAPSLNALRFELRWGRRVRTMAQQVIAGTWEPSPCACFVADHPKAREIHAPDFADRVVHHWLTPKLEAIWEPKFIFDSYANRKGKGSHKAAARLVDFVREVHSGQGGGYFLQLDIKNFFPSIHRPTLWALLKPQMERAGRYPESDILSRLSYYNVGASSIAVPCSVVDALQAPSLDGEFDNYSGPVLPNTRENWKILLASVVAPTEWTSVPAWHGRRGRLPASKQVAA